jgi:putative Mg2+ transporter-C (MgtC) family protein
MLLAASATVTSLPVLSFWELLLRLGLAALLGAVIGLERELRDREAGLRTHLLVAMGSALFTILSAYGFRDVLNGSNPLLVRTDPTRIAAQIVTGIGFLGAGAIIRQGFSIRGLTTAATLWLTAAIGMAAGAGSYVAAAVTTGIALFSLGPLRIIAFRAFEHAHTRRITVSLAGDAGAASVLERMESLGVHVEGFAFDDSGDRRTLTVTCDLPRALPQSTLVRELSSLPDVKGARWGTE